MGWLSIIQNDFYIFSEDETIESLCFIKADGKKAPMMKYGIVHWRYAVTRQQSLIDFEVSQVITGRLFGLEAIEIRSHQSTIHVLFLV